MRHLTMPQMHDFRPKMERQDTWVRRVRLAFLSGVSSCNPPSEILHIYVLRRGMGRALAHVLAHMEPAPSRAPPRWFSVPNYCLHVGACPFFSFVPSSDP